MMKKVCIVALLISMFIGNVFSGSAPKNCAVSGTISDSLTSEELPFASVQLLSEADTNFAMGAITDINGHYSLSEIPAGSYKLSASFMGYNNAEIKVLIQNKKNKVNIALSKKHFSLAEVEVSAEKSSIEKSIEKTTVNVSKNSVNAVGTALEVMQSLPSVDVDFDGNINYRGSDKVIILINGEKSELVRSLDQVPADQIEKIELINNPSAKYDAEGMSGIINIVLKKGEANNSKKTLMLMAGYPETFGGNAGISGMKNKTSYFVNAGINHKTRFQTKEHLRKNYENAAADDYYQYDRQDENLNAAFINSGLEYAISKKQHLGLSLIGSTKFNNADRKINYETRNESGQTIQESIKDIDISLNNYSIDGNINHRYEFKTKKQFLKTNFHYSLLDQEQKMDNQYYSDPAITNPELQNTLSKQLNKEADFSVDYVHPISKAVDIETGYNFNYKDLLNDFSSVSFNSTSEIWLPDTALGNRFNYLQQINALYLSAHAKWKDYEILAGLRAEYTYNTQNSSHDREYFDFFPSLNISRKVGDKVSVFAALSRRINRPTIKMLNPFTDEYADRLNMHIGNPNLLPEYVNSLEVGFRFTTPYISGFGSVYYRNIDQAISRLKFASNDSALLVTFINLDQAKLTGGDFSVSAKPADWWSINASVNIFYTSLKGEYGNNKINRSKAGWNTNISNTFKIPRGFGLQLMAYYRSKLPSAMGIYKERYYMDVALNKKILKGKGRLVFKISDVFNTYRYGLDLDAIDDEGYKYSQRNRRKNESQYFTLSFIYNIDKKEKKKKKNNFYLDSYDK